MLVIGLTSLVHARRPLICIGRGHGTRPRSERTLSPIAFPEVAFAVALILPPR